MNIITALPMETHRNINVPKPSRLSSGSRQLRKNESYRKRSNRALQSEAMTKVADRIAELARAIVGERMRQAKESPDWAATQFLGKLMGANDVDLAEAMLKEPVTLIAAIILYLEEKGI